MIVREFIEEDDFHPVSLVGESYSYKVAER